MLSLIVPCYNEQDNVYPFFDEVCRVFKNKVDDFEFIFINDGSKDGTLKNLKSILKDNPQSKIQIISFSRNFGKEAAIYAGLQNCRGDAACLIDADLQQRPEVVLQMIDKLKEDEDLDCVCAYQDTRHEGKFKTFLKNRFYGVINSMSDIDFVKGASDFRLLKRNVIDAVLELKEIHRFSKGIFSWVGFNCAYIPYEAEDRLSGKSKWNTRKLMKYAFEGIISFSDRPLKISIRIGILTSVLALIYLIVTVIQKLAFGIDVPGYATVVGLVLLLGGLQLFGLGIASEYISKIYFQVKNRPVYIVKEKLLSENEKD